MNVLEYEKYEKMTDTLFTCKDFKLKIVTVFSRKRLKTGNRNFFYNEYTYNNTKYQDKEVRGISRDINVFFVMEVSNWETKEKYEAKIYVTDIFKTIISLKQVSNLLATVYDTTKEGKLKFNNKNQFEPVIFTLRGIGIEMHPVILTNTEKGTTEKGVRIYIESRTAHADLNESEFMAIIYTLDRTDLFNYASSQIAFLGKPEYHDENHIGTNNNMITNNTPFK